MLRDLETRLAGLVEGTFGRLFRTDLTAAELVRGLGREMEAGRHDVLGRTYAPHRYELYLHPRDHERLGAAEQPLLQELSNALLEHAREQRFALTSTPSVTLHTDERLSPGEYGARALGDDAPAAGPSAPPAAPAPAPVASAPAPGQPRPRERAGGAGAVSAPEARADIPPPRLALALEGRTVPLPAAGGVVGRSRDCDVVLSHADVSRRHAEIRPSPSGWTVLDLGSTNGVKVNGRRVATSGSGTPVTAGDRIEMGTLSGTVQAA